MWHDLEVAFAGRGLRLALAKSLMFFDFSQLAAHDAYKLLAGSVVPRPIALISSVGEQGVINVAPYSFFNAIGSDPALVVVGIGDGGAKDTGRNIAARSEFVVNLVSRAMAEAMNICAINFPAHQSEAEAAALKIRPCSRIAVPRLAESPVSLECREHTTLMVGNNCIVFGEVLGLWIRDEFADAQKFHVDSAALDLIGRMGGDGGYTETRQTFDMPRLSYEQWRNLDHR